MARPKPRTILLCLALFLFFLVLRFPYRNLKGFIFGKLYKATRIVVMAEDLYPSFLGWPGVGLEQVAVTIPIGNSDLNIASESLVLRVGLSGLLPPMPAVSMKIKNIKGGGNLYLKVGKGSSKTYARVDGDKINLTSLRFTALSEPFNGLLDTYSKVLVDEANLAASSGTIDLNADNLKTPTFNVPMGPNYSFLIPSMNLGAFEGKIAIKEGSVNFNTFKFGSDKADLSGSLTGDIKLGKDMMGSSINLTLRLKISEAYRTNPQAATFVSFLSTYRLAAQGEFGMRCRASMVDITTRFACAIPEKLPE